MKSNSKTVIVVFTLINGRKNYVSASNSRTEAGKYIVHFTTNVKQLAKEFDTVTAAEDFIPHINNPHQRTFLVGTETIEFTSVKDRHQYEKLL